MMFTTSFSLRARHHANRLAVKTILPPWFDHLKEIFSYNIVQLNYICLLVKTSCLLAENLNGTPVHDVDRQVFFGRGSALIWYY